MQDLECIVNERLLHRILSLSSVNSQGLELILNEQLLQDLELGPAVAPYPPPAPTYPEARDSLIDNEVGLFLLQISSIPAPRIFLLPWGKLCRNYFRPEVHDVFFRRQSLVWLENLQS